MNNQNDIEEIKQFIKAYQFSNTGKKVDICIDRLTVEIDENLHLRATIAGEEINWDKHERKTEIKAITFHKMEVKKTENVKLRAIVDL